MLVLRFKRAPWWRVSAVLHLPFWNMIAGKRKHGGKNVLLYSYLKTFRIPLKKLLQETCFSRFVWKKIPSVVRYSVFSGRLESKL